MSENTDIRQLAERINAKGNTRTGSMVMRMAQMAEDMPSDNFEEAGDVPQIESFVRGKEQAPPIQVHKATVAFAAPHGVSEADIMEYILGIADALGVKVESFNWSVQESKKRVE